jgi:hypothetical protein
MTVKNLNGTSENDCSCKTWLNHWVKFSGRKLPGFCIEITCINRPEVGAHVQKDSKTDRSWYIIPICKKHNNKQENFEILSDEGLLVPANVSETCGVKKAF